MIVSVGYDAAWRVLEVEFRETGEIYDYFEVPPEIYAAFRAAPSKGSYLNGIFKSRNYRYIKIK